MLCVVYEPVFSLTLRVPCVFKGGGKDKWFGTVTPKIEHSMAQSVTLFIMWTIETGILSRKTPCPPPVATSSTTRSTRYPTMTDPWETASVPSSSGLSSGAGLSFNMDRGLPGRVRSLSSPTPPGRLTSLRTRDLTLGGALKKSKVRNDTPRGCK